MTRMLPAEMIGVAYFAALLGAALATRRRRPSWRRTAALSVAGMAVLLIAVQLPAPAYGSLTLRDWWPLLVLPLAYWAPAPLAGPPAVGLERWLAAVDRRAPILTRADGRGRASFDGLLELSYLLVYPMVPAGLLAVGWTGARDVIDAFWPVLLAAVLPCYAMLALLPTRTPRALSIVDASRGPRIRALNVAFLQTFGNSWNTFPSGHAAGAAAIAVLVARAGSPLTWPFALLAAGIALGTVRGRYHYLGDTAIGVALGTAAGLLPSS